MKRSGRWIVPGVLTAVCVACSTLPGQGIGEQELPVLAVDRGLVSELRVQVGCSETKLRTGVATLTWDAGSRALGDVRVDATVYPDGFEHGLYAMAWPLGVGRRFEASARVRASGTRAERPFDIAVDAVVARGPGGRARVRVERLEPGLLYTWRVLVRTPRGWVPGMPVETEAPTCVADIFGGMAP